MAAPFEPDPFGLSAFGQAPAAPAPSQAAPSAAPVKKPRILLADSETAFRSETKLVLEEAGFSVDTAADGRGAIEKVRSSRPDILILDLQMPDLPGLEVARRLRRNPLFASLPIIAVSRSSSRLEKLESLALDVDDFLKKVGELDELLARVGMIQRRNKAILDSNALTHLPGNRTIEARITEAIGRGAPLAVMYFDLNNFKAFNDCYGYEAGDRVIHATAELLAGLVEEPGGENDFLGHIGGDDFIYVTSPERAEALCPRIVDRFEALAPTFYNEADRARGVIVSTDRQGQQRNFGFVGVAIGVAHNGLRRLESFGQVAQVGAELKHHAKSLGERSHFVIDRRGPDLGPTARTT